MSLSKLPDLVKKQICSFLNFEDVIKLEQTNKRIQAFLHSYKFNRPTLHKLVFGWQCYPHDDGYPDFRTLKLYVTEKERGKPIKWLLCKFQQEEYEPCTSTVLNIINKISSIDVLRLSEPLMITEGVGWESLSAKIRVACFGNVRFDVSETTFMNFLKQFKRLEFTDWTLEYSFINDELFNTIADNGQTLLLKLEREHVGLTDLTLEALSRKNIPNEIAFGTFSGSLTTEFIFARIKKLIEAAFVEGLSNFEWHFGTLKEEQYHDIIQFMDTEFEELTTRFMVPEYLISREEYNAPRRIFTIYHRDMEDQKEYHYVVRFFVKTPREILAEDGIFYYDDSSDDYSDEEDNE